MKKILFPLLAFIILFAGCKKEPDTYIINNNNGAYVYTEYPTVSWDQWMDNVVRLDDGTPGIAYIYNTYFNDYINEDLVVNSFALVYYIDADQRDNLMPYILEYTYNGVKHKAIVRYDVGYEESAQNYGVTFILEALDGDYTALRACVPDIMCFKVCMMLNPENKK